MPCAFDPRLNDDLWKNPFLAEYELFVARIRDLLVPIFEDVELTAQEAACAKAHEIRGSVLPPID